MLLSISVSGAIFGFGNKFLLGSFQEEQLLILEFISSERDWVAIITDTFFFLRVLSQSFIFPENIGYLKNNQHS